MQADDDDADGAGDDEDEEEVAKPSKKKTKAVKSAKKGKKAAAEVKDEDEDDDEERDMLESRLTVRLHCKHGESIVRCAREAPLTWASLQVSSRPIGSTLPQPTP